MRTLGDWRHDARRAARLVRPLGSQGAPTPAAPPPLPPGRVVALPGRGELFVREAGRGEPIVLLHGWTMSADLTWWGAYDELARVGRVLAPDLRGHGRGIRSPEAFSLDACADDVAALVRESGAGPVVVCGFSMGGPIALHLWRRHPDIVSGMVFAASALEWRAGLLERQQWRFMGLLERLFRSRWSASLIDRLVRDLVEQESALAAHRDWLRVEYRRGDPAAIAGAGRALGAYDARGFAGQVDVPTTVVVTSRDRMVRPSKQRALAAALADVEVIEAPLDHDAPFVAADRFASTTRAAVESVMRRLAPSDR